MNTRQKISLGSALASVAGTGIALSAILGWMSLPRPWGFLLGLLFGVAAGAGVALVLAGLKDNRHSNHSQ